MPLIADSAGVAALCEDLARAEYVTVDTEFLRDSTYWSKLCLIQLAGPDRAAAIDPLVPDIDLSPVWELMANPGVLKVFHAARQDIEIFVQATGKVPTPIFDTQIAAMVCGHGDQVGYDTLVAALTGARIDKGSRFTDWSKRPLTEAQLEYALADVTHLRKVYEVLRRRLVETDRGSWVEEEDASLADIENYTVDPDRAWERLKVRSDNPRFLALLKYLAAWREREAQRRNAPRNWVMRDETLLDIATQAPTTPEALARSRGLSKSFAEGKAGAALLAAIQEALAMPASERPQPAPRRELPPGLGPTTDLLKVLLKRKCDMHGVAQKLVASSSDLEQIAADDEAPVPALTGWRREVFGEDALALKHGRMALAIQNGGVAVMPVMGETAAAGEATMLKAVRAPGTGRRRRRSRNGRAVPVVAVSAETD